MSAFTVDYGRLVDSEGDFDDCDILIGMDVIRLGDFSISNLRKTVFSFRIPAEGFSPIHGVT
jgi:hypothetical protein